MTAFEDGVKSCKYTHTHVHEHTMHTYIIYMCIGKLNGIFRSHMNIDRKLKTLSHIFEVEY